MFLRSSVLFRNSVLSVGQVTDKGNYRLELDADGKAGETGPSWFHFLS